MWYMYNGVWCNMDALDSWGEIEFAELNKPMQAAIQQTVSRYGLTVGRLTSISYVVKFSASMGLNRESHKVILHYDNGKEFDILSEIPVKILRRFYHAFKGKYIYPAI